MLDIVAKLSTAISAFRSASSKDCNSSLCSPTPRVKNNFVGTNTFSFSSSFPDKNSLLIVLNIRKNGILCQAKRTIRYARYEGKFCQVLKITITQRNLASWSKPIKQRFQEEINRIESFKISEARWEAIK